MTDVPAIYHALVISSVGGRNEYSPLNFYALKEPDILLVKIAITHKNSRLRLEN